MTSDHVHSGLPDTATANAGHYYAEIDSDALEQQGQLIDQILTFALDVLDAQHVEVRVYEGAAPAR